MESVSYSELPPTNLVELLHEKDREIEKLHLLLIQANKRQFGKKSERLPLGDDIQPGLFSFEAPTSPPPAEGETVEVESHTRIVRRGRKPLPDNLPRHRIEHPPETTHCPCCSEKLTLFDGEVTEELEFSPAQFYVNQHVRMKGVCPKGCGGVERGELPDTVQPLARRRPGPGLLAHVLILKFVDHCPLYRQEQGFLRCGIELRRQRLSDWVSAVAQEILLPLGRALKAEVLSSSYAQGDETEIKVQDGEVEGKCHKGYLWAALSPEKDLGFFEYHESRAGSSAKEVFEGFEGTLQTDLYAAYNAVILPEKVDRIACLAHVRRKFIEVESVAKPQVTAVLQMIGKLYALERKWSNAPPPKLLELRQQFSKPELEKLRKYLEELSVKTLPQSPLMKAVSYTLCQWDAIERIFNSGVFQLDNNAIERQIRPVAIGRKNYLFAGSHEGAQNAAIIYSLVATCKLQKVNVYDWMKDVIARAPSYPISRIAELLPHNWKLAKKTP